VAEAIAAIAQIIEASLLSVLKIMQHKVRLDYNVWNKVDAVAKCLKKIEKAFEQPALVLNEKDKAMIES
jgi:hypothetical protein